MGSVKGKPSTAAREETHQVLTTKPHLSRSGRTLGTGAHLESRPQLATAGPAPEVYFQMAWTRKPGCKKPTVGVSPPWLASRALCLADTAEEVALKRCPTRTSGMTARGGNGPAHMLGRNRLEEENCARGGRPWRTAGSRQGAWRLPQDTQAGLAGTGSH